jgi:hypothetical protein
LLRSTTLRGDPTRRRPTEDFNRFLGRLNDACGQVLWLAVPEYDKRGIEHIHLLTHPALDIKTLRSTWMTPYDGPTRSHFWSKELDTLVDLRRHANYLSKTFGSAADQRPSSRRYRNSRHPHPKPIIYRNITNSDLEILTQQIAEYSETEMTRWQSNNYFYPEVTTWAPTPGITADLEHFLNLYKPV